MSKRQDERRRGAIQRLEKWLKHREKDSPGPGHEDYLRRLRTTIENTKRNLGIEAGK